MGRRKRQGDRCVLGILAGVRSDRRVTLGGRRGPRGHILRDRDDEQSGNTPGNSNTSKPADHGLHDRRC